MMSINPTNPISAQPVPAQPSKRDDYKSLAKALRSGDMSTAKAAYADLVKQAPAGATFQPGSPFAELGKALHDGDVDGAKSAFRAMLKNVATKGGGTFQPPPVSQRPVVAPVSSTTGGTAGGTLSAVA